MNLPDANTPTHLYNNKQGTDNWSKSTTTKDMRHICIKDCAVRNSIQAKEVDLYHIPGAINPSDIFTKEMRDRAQFRILRNSFMISAKNFRTFVTSSFVWMFASWVSGIQLPQQ